jgi:hypothetical protein
MRKRKGKLPPHWIQSARLWIRESANHRLAEQREIIVSGRLSPWVLGILAAVPLAPAFGQNLDAGKPASQIFSEVCANCHRSPRELRSNAGTSFLREHYTTGADMASTMATYLSAAGGAGAAQPKRSPAAGATTTRDTPAAEPSPRRAQQAGDPKALPAPPGSTRGRAGSARADAETKPPGTPPAAPVQPVLEEFEE